MLHYKYYWDICFIKYETGCSPRHSWSHHGFMGQGAIIAKLFCAYVKGIYGITPGTHTVKHINQEAATGNECGTEPPSVLLVM